MNVTHPASPYADQVVVGAYVDPALKRRLVELAQQNDRSVSSVIRLTLRRGLAELDAEDALGAPLIRTA